MMSARPRPRAATPDSLRRLMDRASEQGRAAVAGAAAPTSVATAAADTPAAREAHPGNADASVLATPASADLGTGDGTGNGTAPVPPAEGASPHADRVEAQTQQESPEVPAPRGRPRSRRQAGTTKTTTTRDDDAGPDTADTAHTPDAVLAATVPDQAANASPVDKSEPSVPERPAPRGRSSRPPAERKTSPSSEAPAATTEPAIGRRALVEDLPATVGGVKKSFNLTAGTLDLAETWLRRRRQQVRRPSLSALVDAALRELDTDPASLVALAELVPPELLEGGPIQLGLRVRPETAERIEDAQFELANARRRGALHTPLWHCMVGALLVQLEAEGITTGIRIPAVSP